MTHASVEPLTLAVVVLNYDSPTLTRDAVTSIAKADPHIRVTVVDNGSPLQSFNRLREILPETVHIERIQTNEGIPAALNHGLNVTFSVLKVDAVMIVMNDVTVDEVDFGEIRRALAAPRVAAVAPVQCRYDGPNVVHTAGGRLNRVLWLTSHYLNGADYSDVPSEIPPADFLDFSCVAIKRAAWNEVGSLIAEFRFYWDDVEWSVRARQNGWSLAVVRSRCLHRVGGTMGTGINPVALSRAAHNRWATQHVQSPRVRGLGLVAAPLREVARYLTGGESRRRASRFELRGWWDVYVRRLGPGSFRDG